MTDRSGVIFGNAMRASTIRKAERAKAAYLREFGDDSSRPFRLGVRPVPILGDLGVDELTVEEDGSGASGLDLSADERALVIGTIRMGFGHYRISMAIASAARARGLHPYWFDLHSFSGTSGGRIIAKLNGLYSMGSRWSQKYPLFNRLYWEPLNSEGFRKLSYNAVDQKVAEIMATPCGLLPKGVPYVATHAWPAQAALHAGLERVVNVIPDNWPMALHLSEGAIHCVQSPSAWQGYKLLRGMRGDETPKPMPKGSVVYTGHYIDHELVSNLEEDTAARVSRLQGGQPLRVLLTIGGAGAQRELFKAVIERLLPAVGIGRVCLLINVGDHHEVLDWLRGAVLGLSAAVVHSDDWAGTKRLAAAALAEGASSGSVEGVHLFHDADIFAAVYATNLLMRASDLLVTKPSELAFYPIPKLHLRRVGGHEAWGAIRSAELGDGGVECGSVKETLAMLDLLLDDREGLALMNERILAAKRAGVYDGAYRAVDLACGLRDSE